MYTLPNPPGESQYLPLSSELTQKFAPRYERLRKKSFCLPKPGKPSVTISLFCADFYESDAYKIKEQSTTTCYAGGLPFQPTAEKAKVLQHFDPRICNLMRGTRLVYKISIE